MDKFLHRPLRRLLGAILVALSFSPMMLGSAPNREVSGQSVTLAFLGDVMLGRGVHPSAGSFEYLEPFLNSADLTLANLESPLSDARRADRSPYNLCADPRSARVLAEAGFDLLVLANNHNEDCGEAGLLETKTVLEQAGLGSIGPEAKPIFREVGGVHLAFLAFDATGDFSLASAALAVRTAHRTGAVVIVSMHWGAEYQSGPSAGQKEIALKMVQAGADLVWGHHPHVLQPTMQFQSIPVIFSLGNAIFDQYGLASVHQSALLLFKVDAHGVGLQNVIPFVIDVRNSRIVKPSPDEKREILKALGPDLVESYSH